MLGDGEHKWVSPKQFFGGPVPKVLVRKVLVDAKQ